MIVKTVDGHDIKWRPKSGDKTQFSALHLKAKEVIKLQYPATKIMEEVAIPVKRRKTLYLDFYLPVFNLAIEADGSQHFGYSRFFHGNKRKFIKSLDNDYFKEQFCEINGITLIRFKYNESIERWQQLLP